MQPINEGQVESRIKSRISASLIVRLRIRIRALMPCDMVAFDLVQRRHQGQPSISALATNSLCVGLPSYIGIGILAKA